jgi:hypothetical protein
MSHNPAFVHLTLPWIGGVDADGDAAVGVIPIRFGKKTTNNTAGVVITSYTVPDGANFSAVAEVHAKRTDVQGDTGWFLLRGVLQRQGASLVDVRPLEVVASNNALGWACALAKNAAALELQVTGETGKTIKWAGVLQLLVL